MGTVNVEVLGSFTKKLIVQYSVEEGGHAFAITRAISDLTEILPAAIALDHKLAKDNIVPSQSPFGTSPEKRDKD